MKTLPWNRFASLEALSHAEDLVCLSRLRWRWTDSRLRVLLGMAARQWRVFFVELAPASLELPDLQKTGKPVLHVAATRDGIWTVRSAPPKSFADKAHDTANAAMLGRFFDEAGMYEPVIWHLDACAPHMIDALPAWLTLYLKPDMRTWACLPERERAGDAALRKRADCLIDPGVLTLTAEAGWQLMCREVMRVASRRVHAPALQRVVA